MMDGWNMTGWGWTWMIIVTSLGFLVIAVVARALTRDAGVPPARSAEDSALEVLRHRFASGEIDEEEFTRRRATLERRG